MAYVQYGLWVRGLNDSIAGLKAMGAEKEIIALNLKVGNEVVKEARDLVPVRNGDLQGSIKVVKSSFGLVVRAGQDPFIPYANPINWGWFYDKENFIMKNIKPTQFMNKGAAKVRPWIREHYIQELTKIYEKYAGKESSSKGEFVEYTIGSYKS
jgi:hypothetical protein